jgi:hypothetical protein
VVGACGRSFSRKIGWTAVATVAGAERGSSKGQDGGNDQAAGYVDFHKKTVLFSSWKHFSERKVVMIYFSDLIFCA